MADLYYVTGSDNDGEDMSLFIRATSPQEAFDIWKANDINVGWSACFEGVLSSRSPEIADEHDLRFFIIPETTAVGVLEWHKPDGVNCVAAVEGI